MLTKVVNMPPPKIFIVMPARNCAKTLERTYNEIPKEFRKYIVLIDNVSEDNTIGIARKLKLNLIKHEVDMGYGGSIKDGYSYSMKSGADIIVVFHPDNQYDGTKLPQLIKPIIDNKADFVMGSRWLGDRFKGMPRYKIVGNKTLTIIQNLVLGTSMSELHSGMVACRREVLETIPFNLNFNDHTFASDFVAQVKSFGFRLGEIGIPTRYFKEASSVNFVQGTMYTIKTLVTLFAYVLHNYNIRKSKQFTSKSSLKQ